MKTKETLARLFVGNYKKRKHLSIIAFILLVLTSSLTYSQTPEQLSKIIEATNVSKLKKLERRHAKNAAQKKETALELAEANGWEVHMELPNKGYAELQRVTPDGVPIYYTTYNNTDASISTRTNHLNTMGSLGLSLDGQNMRAYIWDGGHIRATHQEFENPDGSSRITVKDPIPLRPIYANYHATHVAGILGGLGVEPGAKGMAPQVQMDSYDWSNDLAEAAAAAANGMLISNHSYGLITFLIPDLYFGGYTEDSRDWDEIQYNAPYYLMVVAAGNNGLDNNYNGNPLDGNPVYDKLTGHAVGKNTLAIANAQDAVIDGKGNLISVNIHSTSSQGPTDDYRVKPDLAGNGDMLFSALNVTDNHYDMRTGTSMSCPNVAGSLLLLQQHHSDLYGDFMKASTLKGLALHTADDAGVEGPDAVFGWGLLNAKAAAEAISDTDNGSIIDELTLSNGASYSITVEASGETPLMASISWTDPAGTLQTEINDTTPVLVNDLDITISQGGNTYRPYRLTGITSNATGDNTVDPFERIDIPNASGTYTITVRHKGTLSGGAQNYSLVVTGLSSTPGACAVTTPTGISTPMIKDVSAVINWPVQSATTHDLRYRQTGTTAWTTETIDGYAYTISGLSPETSYEVQVRSSCHDGTTSGYSSSTTFTTAKPIYCTSFGSPVETLIGNVSLGDINNTSSNYDGYGDFTDISTDLMKGTSNTIAITKEGEIFYAFGFAVYIDYNQNGSFEDTGELVWSTESPYYTEVIRGNFIVPESAVNGATRMRVSMAYEGIPSPCFISGFGEVEDYTVIIEGDGPVNACTSGIDDFPYQEGFENTIGEWTQNTNDDNDWSIHSGTTTSSNTGPSAASEGTFYLYTEASGTGTGYPNIQSILTSPCIDLSSISDAIFSFDYHMYGGLDVGVLAVEASVDQGVNWTSIWSQSENLGDTWHTAEIDLSGYAGGGIQLRFNRTTGDTWQADIAIDNLLITSQSSNDVSVIAENKVKDGVFSIYPIPARGSTMTVITSEIGSQVYTIYDMLGQRVDQGTFTDTITIERLEAGSYILKVGDQAQYSKQFIKL